MVRYDGLYANAHRGKVMKAGQSPFVSQRVAEKPPPSQVFEQVALMTAEESGEYE